LNLLNDSMQLPIRNGRIVENKPLAVESWSNGDVEIELSSDLNVYSCSEGNVKKIKNFKDYGYLIIVKTSDNNLTYSYFMVDSALVNTGEVIKKGQMLGLKRSCTEKKSIYFSVSEKTKHLNARNFLIYGSDSLSQ